MCVGCVESIAEEAKQAARSTVEARKARTGCVTALVGVGLIVLSIIVFSNTPSQNVLTHLSGPGCLILPLGLVVLIVGTVIYFRFAE
jgi:hypothetical protein